MYALFKEKKKINAFIIFKSVPFQGVQLRINVQQFLKTYFVIDSIVLIYLRMHRSIFITAKMDTKAL